MNKKIILFDIDLTLFNNNRFVELKDDQIIKYVGIKNIEKYKRLLPKYLMTLQNQRDFSPDRFIEIVCEKFKFKDKEKLLKLTYKDKTLYNRSLFEDVRETLDILHNKYHLGIFSEGKADFQSFKLNSLGLNKYFEKELIFIVDAKDTKEVIDRLPKDVVIVDDKERICDFLFEKNIDCIWLNRKDERKSDKYKTIHTLLELPDVL